MRIVALVPGGIGDQILFFPTLDTLKRSYPDAEIDVVVEQRAKPAYRLSRSVSDVLTFDYKERNSPADWANLLGVIRDRYYTVALYTGQAWGIELLLWLTGIPTRIGYANSGGKSFLTVPVPYKTSQYQAETYHDLLQGLNLTLPTPALSISIPKSDLDWAEGEQKRLTVKGSGYVLIHDTAASPEAAYPSDRWQTIIQSFRQQQPDLPLVVAQTSADALWVATLVQAFPDLKVTKTADLGKLAAMIAGANLLLCTEGVSMQIAVALQVYTLALFGGSAAPTQVLPQSDKFAAIAATTGKLADIPPEQVLAKIWGG
ncbi:MAG: glycosyltransferase family 9 protein [Leptolyngbyaceae cyanobacterium CRU_2_3]|nr:glycosyltransferase family 9 protein [Leptolyngbyaceae cyanobacterium CRU_2_3]